LKCYVDKANLAKVSKDTIYNISSKVLLFIYYIEIENMDYYQVADDKLLKISNNQKYEAIYYLLKKYLDIEKDQLYYQQTSYDL